MATGKRDYDAELTALLRVCEKHKTLIVPMNLAGVSGEEGGCTVVRWISSEVEELGRDHADA